MNRTLTLNAMYAQALADAVGADFEFGTPDPRDVQGMIEGQTALRITDDTQMALFSMAAITEILTTRAPAAAHEQVFVKHYLDWLLTQVIRKGFRTPLGKERLMHQVRAPGNICLSALQAWRRGTRPQNNSKGCGTVMRLLPFALYSQVDSKQALKWAHMSSALTHGHREIRTSTEEYFQYAKALLEGKDLGTWMPVTYYGEGWTALSCLNMGVAAYARCQTYEQMLMDSIVHPGDSDSTAAVAGAFWGLGGNPLPEYMLPRLKERKVIERVSKEFDKACAGA